MQLTCLLKDYSRNIRECVRACMCVYSECVRERWGHSKLITVCRLCAVPQRKRNTATLVCVRTKKLLSCLRRYSKYTCSFRPLILGHSHPAISEWSSTGGGGHEAISSVRGPRVKRVGVVETMDSHWRIHPATKITGQQRAPRLS